MTFYLIIRLPPPGCARCLLRRLRLSYPPLKPLRGFSCPQRGLPPYKLRCYFNRCKMYASVFITSRCCKWILPLRSMTFYLIIRLPPPGCFASASIGIAASRQCQCFSSSYPPQVIASAITCCPQRGHGHFRFATMSMPMSLSHPPDLAFG